MFKSSSAKLHFNVKDSNACLKLKMSYIKCKRFKSCKFSINGKRYMDNGHAQILSFEQMFLSTFKNCEFSIPWKWFRDM